MASISPEDAGVKTNTLATQRLSLLDKAEKPYTQSTPERRRQSRSPLIYAVFQWKAELGCWFASLCFFAAIIGVLKVFDGQSLPDLPFGITLGAIVGLLATFAEGFFMIPIASTLGQSKWLRARQRRTLDQFRMMDEASRGSWGSFLMLLRGKGG